MTQNRVFILIEEGGGITLEFKEKYTPKISQDICAFANSAGGKLVLGIADDGSIKGEQLTGSMKAEIFSLGRNCDPPIEVRVAQLGQVIEITVPAGEEKPYACGGSYYKRFDAVTQKLNRNELKTIFNANEHFHFDEKLNPKAKLADLSLEKIRRFIKETGKAIRVTNASVPHLLESLRLIHGSRITNAAVLMFAKNTGHFFTQCQTHLVAFKGSDRVNIYDKKYVQDDLLTQFNEAVAFCEKHLNERAEIKGLNRHDIYEIPMTAIREAIVNAIIHRDYSISGTNIQVEVHADRVEISNPGGLPTGFSTAMLGKRSVRRNEVISELFHRMEKSERMGSGIGRIRKLLKAAGIEAPLFESNMFFTITLERPEEYRSMSDSKPSERFPEKVPRNSGQVP